MAPPPRSPPTNTSLLHIVHQVEQLAPPAGAAEWDNTGWILRTESTAPVRRILLCIDLTPAVAEEARRSHCGLVVAYHPPLFQPVRRLDAALPTHRALLACAASNIPVYSPHTALDAAPNGLNDWLARQAGDGRVESVPGTSARRLTLEKPESITSLAGRLKARLRIPYLRIASAPGRSRPAAVRTLGVCAGAGASALRELDVDAWVTGEVSHHDALAAVERGMVILHSEHARTERPYLPVFARRLRRLLGEAVSVVVSRADRDFHRLA